jgi:Zn-dependent protease
MARAGFGDTLPEPSTRARPMNEPPDQTATAAETATAAPPKRKSPLGIVLAGLAVIASKAKFLLAGVKFLPFGKLAITSLTMLTSIWLYAQMFGFSFAVGFVVLLLLHELGHGAAMKMVGVEAGWPIFIPFFGAAISLKSMPRSAHDHAVIAYGGPLAGTAASLACAGLALVTHERYWLALAHTGFFLNLFNLIPVQPLDGGRVASGFSPKSWIVGAVLLAGMFLVTHAPQLLLIAVLALVSGMRKRAPMEPMSDEERTRWTVRYFGLCFALGAAMYFTHRLLEPAA